MGRGHEIPGRDIPPSRASQSRTSAYAAARRAAILGGLRHCVALLDVLGGLHAAVAPGRAAVHPSQEWLAGELGCSVSTVRAQLDALAAAGIIGRAVSQATPTGERGRWVRRTNRYWLQLRRIWARIRAGRTYRRSTGAMPSLRDAESLGAATPSPPPTPEASPAHPLAAPEAWAPPTEAERAAAHAHIAAIRHRLAHRP